MKFLAVLTLVATLSPAFAGEVFGGFNFHSSVAKNQSDALKTDLRYLFKAPVTEADSEFLSTAKLQVGDGKNMHNWLLNRIKYVVGESYELNETNIAVSISGAIFFKFPTTPLPEMPDTSTSDDEPKKEGVVTVMSNLGGALYIGGKKAGIPIGLKLDGDKVYAKSTRVGILQVGEGLFLERFLLNKDVLAPANSISRLATLFHEARHSDGNGKSTGFLHAKCPVDHAYVGHYACEAVGNGPYTVGALAERHLLKNCTSCSEGEKNALAAKVADAFGRILDLDKVAKKQAFQSQINSHKSIVDSYKTLLNTITDPAQRETFTAELERLEAQLKVMEQELADLSTGPATKPAFLDATPEGEYKDLTVQASEKLMLKSLK